MIDIGVNLFSPQFDGEHNSLLEAASNAGVEAVIITGTTLANSQQAIDYCQQRQVSTPKVYATAGVHPHHADEVSGPWLQELEQLAKAPEVIALGEMGLDYFRNIATPQNQQRCFADQASLAAQCQLPLFVHDRDASTDTLDILTRTLGNAGHCDLSQVVVHCFTGGAQALEAYLEAGCYIGITGWVCDAKRGQELSELVPKIPLSRLLIETDAPYLRPQNAPAASIKKHKRRNAPDLLPYVAQRLGELMGVNVAQLQTQTTANARRLFKLDPASTTQPPAL